MRSASADARRRWYGPWRMLRAVGFGPVAFGGSQGCENRAGACKQAQGDVDPRTSHGHSSRRLLCESAVFKGAAQGNLGVRCASMRKGDKFSPSFLQKRQASAFLSLPSRLASLTVYTELKTRETGESVTKKLLFAFLALAALSTVAPAKELLKSGQRWSCHPGIRSGCLLHRPPAGQRQRRNSSLTIMARNITLPPRNTKPRLTKSRRNTSPVRRLLRVRCQPGKDCPGQDRGLADSQWTAPPAIRP